MHAVKVAMFSRFPRDLRAPRGGVETVTLALSRALTRVDGIDLHVVALEKGLGRLEITQCEGITVHRLPRSRWPQMLDVVMGPGRKTVRSYLANLAPDIVHFHETYGLGIGWLPMPYVITIHGFDDANIMAENGYLAWLRVPAWQHILRRALARQEHIISITPYVKDRIRPLTRATIYEIDNPIDPACFTVPRHEVAGRVFYAGWVSPRKNALGLVRAFAEVARAVDHASLHIAGELCEPGYVSDIREAIVANGLTDQVVLLGRISPETIRKELGEACVFVLPSFQENAPMAIAEAMATGVPIITSNRCGMPFMVDESKTGFLVEPEDTHAMADRITTLLDNDNLRHMMGTAASHVAQDRFHPDSVARKTVAVYRGILSSARP